MATLEEVNAYSEQYGDPLSQGVNIVDQSGKKVDTIPYSATSGAAFQDGGAIYKDQETGEWVSSLDPGIEDPYTRIGQKIDRDVSFQAPKVKVANNQIIVQAPKEVLTSPLVSQIKEELKSLKGSDLNNPEVKRAIDALNDEVSKSIKGSLLSSSTGWTLDQYNDYQYAKQSTSGTNPMASTNKIKGRDKDGNIVEKTPQEWIDYYREVYNTDERSKKFLESYQSNDPYNRTMALVMGQGGTSAVYGFDLGEQIGQGWKALTNQVGKAPEGMFRTISTDANTRRMEELSRNLDIPSESLRTFNVNTETKFDDMKNQIRGKSWDDLSNEEKAFVLTLGVSRESKGLETWQKEMIEGTSLGGASNDVSNMSSNDEEVSANAINAILDNGSFDKYKETRNNYDTWQNYDEWSDEGERELANTANWSGSYQTIGNIAGVLVRFLWENAVVKGLTGGISAKSLANPNLIRGAKAGGFAMNAISEDIGGKIVEGLSRFGISPVSNAGKNALRFAADLLGTIPEDIVQTAMDNVLTYNSQDNDRLFDAGEMSANFGQNLVFMSLFNIARAGFNSVKRSRLAKQLAEQSDLASTINIDGINADVDDIARAVDNGGGIKVEGDKVSVVDNTGKETVLKNTTPEQGKMIQQSLFDQPDTSKRLRDELAEPADQPTVKVEIDTPEGRVRVDTPDYMVRSINDGLKVDIDPTPANVKSWHRQTLNRAMTDFAQVHLPDFQTRFPNVQASDFDWVFYNTRNGLNPEQIIGTVDPTTGREITREMIDAMQWFADQPFMKDLRMASREALGLEDDFNILGYLPHTTYDPSNLSFDEALTGQLWREYTGSSMIGDDNMYKGFGGDFNSRYRTFASNMLWDAKNTDVAAAKLIEEAAMDGKTLSTDEAKRVVERQKDIVSKVDNAASTKDLEKSFLSDENADKIDYNEISDKTIKDGETSGLGKSIHDNWAEVYYGADSAPVVKQSGKVRQGFDTLGDTMKNTIIQTKQGRRMSMYDYGGADFVYAPQNAVEIVNRFTRDGGDLREMLTDFIVNHSHRSPETAEFIADKWMSRIGDIPGELTKGKVIQSLSNSMKWEAMGRIRKFLVMAQYDQFNDATKKTIDRFLFNHMQMDSIKNNGKIIKKLGKALNTLTSMRYRALFYGNLKNALLQTSELNRLFTTFKWGDTANMMRKMATDGTFRARVNDYVKAVAPDTDYVDAALYGKYSKIADNMETTADGVSFKDGIKKAGKTIDDIALAPINKAEAFKNRMMVAALVQEADSKGLVGDEALRYIRNRFERVALAMNELGRIGLANNPMARTMLFLQNFQIRELGMHMYNLRDAWMEGTSVPKKVYNAAAYLNKVLGTKLATTLILARLGYSSAQTLGVDPFGLLDDYTGMDEEDMEPLDYAFKSPIFAGGMTSLISDMYFMARKAYEESHPKTVSEEAEEEISGESSWGLEPSFDQLMNLGQSFVPGNVFINRLNQMNQMMDTGWATSASGNKMYTAPNDPWNILLGYLFGRSATENAQQYNQTYGSDLLQTLGRINPFRQYGEFDPIDKKNYSDWFRGDGNDLQQFNKGLRYFRSERDRIIDTYEDAIRRGYSSDEDAEAKNNMNRSLNELYSQMERFVDAYEKKSGTIDSNMAKQLVNVLNTGRKVVSDTPSEAESRSLDEYSKALERYSNLGLSPVGTYTGPTTASPKKEVKYQGSPQYRTAVSGKYTINSEATAVLKEADRMLEDVRKNLKDAISRAYDAKDYDEVARIQESYLEKFDDVVSPIIASYGAGILSSTDVTNQLKDMLSTGTSSRTGDLIPSEQYRKDKYGKYRSMPMETVDVKKWAQQRFSGDTYNKPSTTSYSSAYQDLSEIRNLAASGKNDTALAKALQLKVRVDNQKRALSEENYNWLLNFLNNGGK